MHNNITITYFFLYVGLLIHTFIRKVFNLYIEIMNSISNIKKMYNAKISYIQ